MAFNNFLAFDLGATSGRAVVGTLSDNKLEIQEIDRFPNNILNNIGHCYWDIFSIYRHILHGLSEVAERGIEISSIGIDTWGVDFALIDRDGSIIGLPYSYRDPHTVGASQHFFKEIMSSQELYSRTGIQVMDFNTLFQLYTLKCNNSPNLSSADKLLFMPDALTYMLTGEMVSEYSIASTSHFLNPFKHEFDFDLLGKIGVPQSLFSPIVMPGHTTGMLKQEIADEVGIPPVPVISVAGHDTASAVAAVPAENERFAYLSSGTWSLMGIEVKEPIVTPEAEKLNITNEGGINGTTRFLKNITGMWILERVLKEWSADGKEYSYSEIVALSHKGRAFRYFINPDDPLFANPESMIAAIDNYCLKTGQGRPVTDFEYVRCIFESLAMRYKEVEGMLAKMAPFPIEKLYIIGGGSKNEILNQFTANALNLPVVAGPSEATAVGNILIQASASGMVPDLCAMRKIVAQSVDTKTYMPQDTELWNGAYGNYLNFEINK